MLKKVERKRGVFVDSIGRFVLCPSYYRPGMGAYF